MPKDTLNKGHNQKFSEFIDEKVDNVVATTRRKVWHAMTAVAASSFGKGVLLTAAVLVGGYVLAGGFAALTGAATATGLAHGLAAGFSAGMSMLGHGAGLAMMAIGGIAGAAQGVRHEHQKINAAEARAEERALEQARQPQVQQQVQLQPSVDTDRQRDIAAAAQLEFAARELRRRSEAANSLKTI